MIVANPITNEPAAATDAARTHAAGAQGRAGRTCSPETARKRIGLFRMAVEGMDFARCSAIDSAGLAGLSASVRMLIARGIDVYQAVDAAGPDGVRSISDARALRIMLGYASGRLDGLHHDTRASETGFSLTDIAEIRMGIRDRNGSMRREWC